MNQRVDVCVRGSGAVGTSLALALARQGLSVAITAPPAASASTDVRAYALNAASCKLLTELKVWAALPHDAVTAVHDMRVAGDADGAGIDFSSWQQGVDALAWIVDAAELDAALRAAVRFAPHLQTVAEPVDAALTVWADGKATAAVQALGVKVDRHAYGHSAVAARLRCDAPHGHVAWQWFRAPDVLALLPFDRPVAGHGFGLVWSMPTAQADELLALSDADFEARINQATGGKAGHLRLGSSRAAWPLSLATAKPLCGPGWVLVGDAAHVVHPLAGQGLNLGLADVLSLAAVVAAREPWRSVGDEQVLRRHVRARALPTLAMARVTDGLLHLFANDQPLVREFRNRGMTLLNHLAPIKRLITAKALDA
jgi:2-polyprenyl-6-methoxyphenol hydroxylase-like FAD-dependent oxidoreductase